MSTPRLTEEEKAKCRRFLKGRRRFDAFASIMLAALAPIAVFSAGGIFELIDEGKIGASIVLAILICLSLYFYSKMLFYLRDSVATRKRVRGYLEE